MSTPELSALAFAIFGIGWAASGKDQSRAWRAYQNRRDGQFAASVVFAKLAKGTS